MQRNRGRARWKGAGTDLSAQVAALFAAGEVGGELAPYDFSTMWQDLARTQPVTGPGQAVASALLKYSGGLYFVQTTMTSRWVLRQDGNGLYYLELDGVDDRMLLSGSVNLNAGLASVALASSAPTGRVLLSTGVAGYVSRGGDGGVSWSRNNGGARPESPLPFKARQSLSIGTNGTTSTEFLDSTGAGGVVVSNAGGLNGSLVLGAFDDSGALPLAAGIYSLVLRAGPYTAPQADLLRRYGVQRMGSVS